MRYYRNPSNSKIRSETQELREVYGPGVEALVRDEDQPGLKKPIVAPPRIMKFKVGTPAGTTSTHTSTRINSLSQSSYLLPAPPCFADHQQGKWVWMENVGRHSKEHNIPGKKMIEGAGARFVVIVDESKLVPRLGCTGSVPVEVVPFGSAYTLGLIRMVFDKLPGFHARLRTVKSKAGDGQEELFLTDNGNHIVEMFFEDGIHGNLRDISDSLLRITGVVEHGMFLGMATKVIVAKKDGTVAVLSKK
ncbi:unnamed protein product [Triticum turgidum subsp. durum]|uniref:ribose-5-phosphate isomerase n=1 Tax=Triticum turgidum subsp. durum TaxID=4567 RepID=A0A9R1NUQ5_TRITD|nr:unnamed protein product [Triticum turgidum subsp. durum]